MAQPRQNSRIEEFVLDRMAVNNVRTLGDEFQDVPCPREVEVLYSLPRIQAVTGIPDLMKQLTKDVDAPNLPAKLEGQLA